MTTIARTSLATLLVLLTHSAFAAPVPFTGSLSIDFTGMGGTALTIPGGGSVTINGGSGMVSPITSLTIPPGVFAGAGSAGGGSHMTVTGTAIGNGAMAFTGMGSCTAGHFPWADCPGGGLAGTGGITGLNWRFVGVFTLPGSNVGVGSSSQFSFNRIYAAGWTTGPVAVRSNAFLPTTAPVSSFTGSQTASTISLVSPISMLTARAVARINLSLTLTCGDSLISSGEQCDDGGTTTGDGCDATCQVESSWGCTGAPSVCSLECPSTLDGSCLTGFTKGVLLVKENKPGKEKILAKLIKGPNLVQSDFGDPIGGTTAALACIYDDASALVGELIVDRAGDTCAGKACWKAIGDKGYLYKDKETMADGVKIHKLKASDSGKSLGLVKAANNSAKGQLSMPTGIAAALSSSANATVQLRASSESVCLSVTVDDIKKQESDFFKALTS